MYFLFFLLLILTKKKCVYCSWLTRTDPADVARVESRTFVVTTKRSDAIPNRMDGVAGQLGNWMSPEDLPKAIQDRFPNCMKGLKLIIIIVA
jgi:phosphoenolpyruvate carboxykinase (GTP)